MRGKPEFPDPPVRVEMADGVVWMTLSRPEKANALNLETIEALLAALDNAERDPGLHAVVIRGAGRNFCAGADLMELQQGGALGVRQMLEPLRRFLNQLEVSRLVTVAAVQGAARAGGLELVLACDAVVATTSATFGDAHLGNGLLPAGGATARLPRAVGWQRAKWLILSSKPIDAATAKDWGLVLEIVDEGADLIACAVRAAAALTTGAPESVAQVKRLLANAWDKSLDVSLEAEITALEAHADSQSFRTGITRFLDRHPKGGNPD